MARATKPETSWITFRMNRTTLKTCCFLERGNGDVVICAVCVIPISKGYERSCAESEAENLSETMCFFVSGFVAGG